MDKEMNVHAQHVIEKTLERQSRLKKKTLEELIRIVNGICRRKGLTYFAVGDLLTMCEYGEDSDPERMEYLIVMMRDDYDVFMKYAAAAAEKLNYELQPFYGSDGRVIRMHSYISVFREERTEDGYASVRMLLRIDPYEYVPFGDKYQSFTDVLKHNSRKLIAESMTGISGRPDEKAAGKIQHALPGNNYRTLTEKYRGQLRRYTEKRNTGLVGRLEHVIYSPHPVESIFPVHKERFLGTTLSVPASPEKFMNPPKNQYDEQVFGDRLRALKLFDRMCSRNGIEFTIMGNLSSDCSHYQESVDLKRFQAWQIGLMRSDYELAVALLQSRFDPELVLFETVDGFPQVHSNHVGFILAPYLPTDPWINCRPIELYPLDPLPEAYDEYQEAVRASIRTYRHHRRMINGEICSDYDPRQHHSDTWAEYEKMQQERMALTAGVGEDAARVFTIFNNRPRLYRKDQIFPVVRRKLNGIDVWGPAVPYLWHEPKDDAYTEYVAAGRTEILKIFDTICTREHLEYFAIANLLIGAAIYHDFVPESNNRNYDLGMLRPDYERMLSLLRSHAGEYGVQLNEYRDDQQRYPLLTKTISWPGQENSDIYIRFLPFDKVPEDFYMYHGFVDDMDRRNERMKLLLNSHTFTGPVNHTFIRNPVTRAVYGQFLNRKPDAGKMAEAVSLAGFIATEDPVKAAADIDCQAQIFNDDERTDRYARVAMQRSKAILGSELFPLQRIRFRDMKLSCPGDYSVWQPMLNDELQRQVDCIQRADLILLQEMDRVCKELGVGYFVCGGTMLGYMRHEGFIPWDDDVDVAMLRSDYDRFCREAAPYLKEKFFLQTRETDPHIPYLFSKLRLDDTEYITEYNKDRDFHKGICLDIFPFDFLPDRPENCQPFIKEVLALSAVHNNIANHQYALDPSELKPRNADEKRYLKEQTASLKKYWAQDLAKSQADYVKAATRYNEHAREEGLTMVASFIPDFTYIDLNDLLPYQRGMFAGVEVSVPKRPDVFLTMQYGDFMKLPPKHQQVAHRLVRWSTWTDHGDDGHQTED